MNSRSIFLLRLDESATHLDGVQFVGSDAPVEYLIVAGLGVEVPLAFPFDNRNRQRPILLAYRKNLAVLIGRIL